MILIKNNLNYLSVIENSTLNMTSDELIKYPVQIHNPHNHTRYECERAGHIYDDCYICECEEDNTLIAEHCYKSDALACVDAKPTFIKNYNTDSFISKFIKLFT